MLAASFAERRSRLLSAEVRVAAMAIRCPMRLSFAAAERDSYHRLQLQRTFQAVVPWAERAREAVGGDP